MRNDPASLGRARRKGGTAGRVSEPGPGRAEAVAIVVCDGVGAFELGVACDVFGSSWSATFGVPWYRSFVCGVTPGLVTVDAGFEMLAPYG